jgi:hypothetical protein
MVQQSPRSSRVESSQEIRAQNKRSWQQSHWKLAERDAIFGNRQRLTDTVVGEFERFFLIRAGEIGGEPALDVLSRRLAALPWPEFRLLAAYILDKSIPDSAAAGPAFWLHAVQEEQELQMHSKYE